MKQHNQNHALFQVEANKTSITLGLTFISFYVMNNDWNLFGFHVTRFRPIWTMKLSDFMYTCLDSFNGSLYYIWNYTLKHIFVPNNITCIFFSIIWFLSYGGAKYKKRNAFHLNFEHVCIFQGQFLENCKRLCLRSHGHTIVDFLRYEREISELQVINMILISASPGK